MWRIGEVMDIEEFEGVVEELLKLMYHHCD